MKRIDAARDFMLERLPAWAFCGYVSAIVGLAIALIGSIVIGSWRALVVAVLAWIVGWIVGIAYALIAGYQLSEPVPRKGSHHS